MEYVKSFRDLEVYKLAREVARHIFILTKGFPREETYSLTDQMRRSSRSIGAQTAEAWGKRRYETYFISKLTDSDAEQLETKHWIEVSEENGYFDSKTRETLINKCKSIGKMLQKLIDKANTFCKP